MKIDNINVEEVLEDLTKRVEKLESYHTIKEIKLSYNRYSDTSGGSYGGTWSNGIVNTTAVYYYMSYQIVPEGVSEEGLILEKEGEKANAINIELVPTTHEIKIQILTSFGGGDIVTINLYSPDRKVKGSLTVVGSNESWNL